MTAKPELYAKEHEGVETLLVEPFDKEINPSLT